MRFESCDVVVCRFLACSPLRLKLLEIFARAIGIEEFSILDNVTTDKVVARRVEDRLAFGTV